MFAEQHAAAPEPLRDSLRAKVEADRYLRKSDLTHTVVRPGELTNEPATAGIRTAADLSHKDGDVPREDVAHTLAGTLTTEATHDVRGAVRRHSRRDARQQRAGQQRAGQRPVTAPSFFAGSRVSNAHATE